MSNKIALITGVIGQDGFYLAEFSPKKAMRCAATPASTLAELVKEMVLSDYTPAKRDSLVKLAGFQAYDYHD